MAEQTTGSELEQVVEVSLGGETRQVAIKRLSVGHCWFAKDLWIICRFRTGTKTHMAYCPQVIVRGGKAFFPSQVVHNRHTTPVQFGDDLAQVTSRWRGQ